MKHVGFLFTKLIGVANMRRAASEPRFEVILSHEGASSSSSSPCGKNDRSWPHEDNSALQVILPNSHTEGKNSFYESYIEKSYHSVSHCLCLKVFSAYLRLNVGVGAAYFQRCILLICNSHTDFDMYQKAKGHQKVNLKITAEV